MKGPSQLDRLIWRLGWLRWLVVLVGLVVLANEIYEHFLVQGEGLSVSALGHVVALGLIGPGIAVVILTWLRRSLSAQGQAEAELEWRNRQLLALDQAAATVVQETSMEAVLERMAEVAREIARARYSALGIRDEEGRLTRFITSGWEGAQGHDPPPTGRGLLGIALREGSSLRVADIGQDPRRVGFPEGHPAMKSLLGVPIVARSGEVVGELYVTERVGAEEFSPDDERLLTLMANHAAIAIENAQLLEAARERAERIEVVSQVARTLTSTLDIGELFAIINEQLRHLIPFDRAQMALLDPSGQRLRLVRLTALSTEVAEPQLEVAVEESFLGAVIREQRLELVADYEEVRRCAVVELLLSLGIRSGIIAPLSTRGQPLGVLMVGSLRPKAFSAAQAEVFSELAAQVSVAVDNAQHYEEAQRTLARLADVTEVNKAISSTLKAEEVLERICRLAVEGLGMRMAWVGLVEEGSYRVGVAAAYGEGADYANEITVTWDDEPTGRGPTGTAIKTGEPFIQGDLESAPSFAPWRPQATAHGFRSSMAIPLIYQGQTLGALNLYSEQLDYFTPDRALALSALADQAAIALGNAQTYAESERRRRELEQVTESLRHHAQELEEAEGQLREAFVNIGRTLDLALAARDPYLGGHATRNRDYARAVATEMGLPREEIRKIEVAAELHDIGKLAVPDSILLKPGPLTPAEWAVMRRHPTTAVEMLRFLDFLKDVLPLIEGDHERWDGKGYPNGLVGEENPLGARILAVSDAYDAMTSDRPYRPALSHEEALAELRKGAGTQFDPQVVEVFLKVFPTPLLPEPPTEPR